MTKALVTDAHYRMALAAIRSLGRRSIPVTALENDNIPAKSVLGFYSRYAADTKTVPPASENSKAFAAALTELAGLPGENMEKPVLIPVGLDSLMAVSDHRELLSKHLSFIVPPHASLEIANDTERLLPIAAGIGIPCPETTTLGKGESMDELANRLTYPVVVKYRQGELLKLKAGKRYRIIHDPGTFIREFAEMHKLQSHPIVQRYISGPGYGVSAVFDRNGSPLEIFCHKRLREYPASGGPSCFCESVWNDRLVGYAVKLLKALEWRGVAMVEFKGDPEGEVCLMEINPRFWGSMPLSVISGCDIPYALYRASLGECLGEASDGTSCRYRQGVRMRYLLQDLMSVPGYLKAGKGGAGFLLKFAGQLLNPSIKDGVFEARDWRPSLAYLKQALKKL